MLLCVSDESESRVTFKRRKNLRETLDFHSNHDTREQLQKSTLGELSNKMALRPFDKKFQIMKICLKQRNFASNGVYRAKNSQF